ncbi:MAG TPA: DNA-binding response regulator [Sphingobium sp.]|jgi:two-component system response regulator TctD|uniref:response regulator n=1 Tax=unclassified Sphingobium TaxID=2611147 RepID=UPI0007F39ED7|nr:MULTISPECIES: response regulator transcription factor [unclassified Sphingobium]OAN59303.1 DNA-binding response regulator [Sphingobium sp. TCM1]WIW90080.1 response regulator transcription factor [Sphingobium sp. V4]HAF42194.1 DNA-binding response regulator [Sphingobium sp.]
MIEDDAALARSISTLLRAGGHAVDHVANGEDAMAVVGSEPYALVILDVGLPDMDGFAVLAEMRRRGEKVPVLMLTARDALDDRVRGLDLGADDYLRKPFDPEELEARVRALGRRRGGDPIPELSVGTLTINRSTGTAEVAGRPLDLRRRELAVLESLATRAGQVVPRELLIGEVFGFDEPVGGNAIEVHVTRLRGKLAPDGPGIRTVRGVGYMLDAG